MKYGEGVMGNGIPSKSKLGVFDSGTDGLLTAEAIQKALPDYEIIYAGNNAELANNGQSPNQIQEIVLPILLGLANHGCRVIVIVGNRLTVTTLNVLRHSLKVPLINMASGKVSAKQTDINNASLQDIIRAAKRAIDVQRAKD